MKDIITIVRQYNRGGDHALASDVMDEEHNTELLSIIVEMWMTVRGFAIVSNWLEEYKRARDKLLKGVKILRKGLKINNYEDHV